MVKTIATPCQPLSREAKKCFITVCNGREKISNSKKKSQAMDTKIS
jgi:hypothetical protein